MKNLANILMLMEEDATMILDNVQAKKLPHDSEVLHFECLVDSFL